MLCLGHVFEGIFLTEKNVTIETDELEQEEESKNSVKNEEQQHRRNKQGFAGGCWKSVKLNRKTKERAVAYGIARSKCLVA